MSDPFSPLRSLKEGHWFKLICGASFQHLPSVRWLTLAYTLAGADCIDVAADPAVVTAAKTAMALAAELAQQQGLSRSPWLMVSLNDGEDPHFRKAEFEPQRCPVDCQRPCETICPADAIVFESWPPTREPAVSGVLGDRCYGCGRCLPVCPVQHITTRAYVSTPQAVASLVLPLGVDAIEIHTQVGRLTDFQRLWQAIEPWLPQLKLVAVSCPDGEDLVDYLRSLYTVMSPLPCALIWQTDGRPMSGDIGTGTTRAAIKLGQKVLAAQLPGFVQLAGGTNDATVPKLRALGLLSTSNPKGDMVSSPNRFLDPQRVAGVAYGSYARRRLLPVLERLEQSTPSLEAVWLPHQHQLVHQAVTLAASLVSQLKPTQVVPPWFNDAEVEKFTMMP